MQIDGEHYQSIWYDADHDTVCIIDQTRLPHQFNILKLQQLSDACTAIADMQVRGAPLIGVTAAYGVYLGLREQCFKLDEILQQLAATRPTAVNLQWALQRVQSRLQAFPAERQMDAALGVAQEMEQEDIAVCEAIGNHGADILATLWANRIDKSLPLQILTHCNAGALATVDWGTALAAVYKAAARNIPLHVWVDETRPRNQGASLTCWELGMQGIPHTLIVDNAGGHLMQQGRVDVCLVGSDRTTAQGDVCNKIGTYLKALSARDNQVPFYVALPVSSIDFSAQDPDQIVIEERLAEEVNYIAGVDDAGGSQRIRISPADVTVANPGFDVTPARLVSGLITEHGVFGASAEELEELSKRVT